MAKKKISTKKIKKSCPKKEIKRAPRKNQTKMRKKSSESVYQPKIGVIGIGGGGGSIVSEIAKSISRKKVPHAGRIKFIVANVDYQAIKATPKQTEVFYFGQKTTHGLGCGMDVALGEQSAIQDKKGIEKLLKKCDFCIFITCLGGGTGSGATPIFAEISKNLGILTLGICTLPFGFEGSERARIAKDSLQKIKSNLNTFVIIPNQRIFRIVDQKTPIHKSLSTMNSILVKTLEGFIETLYCPGLINLDFSDFQTILARENSLTYINCEEFSGLNRAEKVVEAVLKNPLINYDITGVERMLFNIVGSKDMKMSEIEQISKRISDFNPEAKIIFGVLEDNHYKNKIKITLIASGCQTKKPKPPRSRLPRPDLADKESTTKKEEKGTKPIVKGNKKKKDELDKKPEEKKTVVKAKIEIVKKKKKKKKPNIAKKTTIRRDALDLHKQVEEDERKMLEQESKWDIPAFLREDNNS